MTTVKNDTAFPAGDDDESGLTKREYFAVHILAGIMADSKSFSLAPATAVRMADRLIFELNKPSEIDPETGETKDVN